MEPSEVIGYEFAADYYADVGERRILRDGKPILEPLTSKEFEVLAFFLDRPKEVIPRAKVQPLNEVSRSTRHPTDDYISKLNTKLGWKPKQNFKLIRNIGYQLIVPVRPIYSLDQQEAGKLHKISLLNLNNHTLVSMRA